MVKRTVKTPCIGVCSTGIGDRVCRGCKRFAHEVIHWNSYNEEEKGAIELRLSQFLSQCTRNKLLVVDAALLEEQLRFQQIAYPQHRDVYCWAYCLLKAAGSQIGDPEQFGMKVDVGFTQLSLKQLRQLIDDEFYVLSDAYYERYLSAAETA
jgi:predicted Fe-S protein YdhL (DUF1289 family)